MAEKKTCIGLRKIYSNCPVNVVLYGLIIFLLFALLVWLFPYSGDDWAWGCWIGLERFLSFFDNYNGRYGGNLLVMILTRYKWVNVLFTASFLLIACWLPGLYTASKRKSAVLFSLTMFLFMPPRVWVQAVSWTAGFSNYVPPIVLIGIYLVMIGNIFAAETPRYGKIYPLIAWILGFVSSLFMENITLYGLALAVCVVIYVKIRHKRFYVTHLLNLMGSLLGTICMFSNTAYRTIAQNEDTYRTVAMNNGIVDTVTKNIGNICQYFFFENMVMVLIVTVLCVALVYCFMLREKNQKSRFIVWMSAAVHVLCFCMIAAKHRFPSWLFSVDISKASVKTNMLLFGVILLYFISILLIVVNCVGNKSRMMRSVFMLVSIMVLIAPLAVVTPIGPRCFFAPYLMAIFFCTCIYEDIAEFLSINSTGRKVCELILIAAILCQSFFFLNVYGTIHVYDVKRQNYIFRQIEQGYTSVKVCELPFESYVHCGKPTEGLWEERYKYFYGIDEDIDFELMSYKEFNKWTKTFD